MVAAHPAPGPNVVEQLARPARVFRRHEVCRPQHDGGTLGEIG
jgi:hypothetical protein